MACTLSPLSQRHTWTNPNYLQGDDLSSSQLFLPLSFSFLDAINTNSTSSSGFRSLSSSYASSSKTFCGTRPQQHQKYIIDATPNRSHLESVLDGLTQPGFGFHDENNENLAYFRSRRFGSLSSQSTLLRKKPPTKPVDDPKEERSHSNHRYRYHHRRYPSASASTGQDGFFTQNTTATSIGTSHFNFDDAAGAASSSKGHEQQRRLLIPPRPRLCSPLSPHPNAPQPGPNPRRPLPNKRRRVEIPLLKKALSNRSNLEKPVLRSSHQSTLLFNWGQHEDWRESHSLNGQVLAVANVDGGDQDDDGGSGDDDEEKEEDGVLCSASGSESEFKSELDSSWVYIPFVPSLSTGSDNSDGSDWELILKGELY